MTSRNPVGPAEDPSHAYNSEQNTVLQEPTTFNFISFLLTLKLKDSAVIRSDVNTFFELCCFILPGELKSGASGFTIFAKNLGKKKPQETEYTLEMTLPEDGVPQPLKSVPQIVRVNYWTHLEMNFDPALSSAQSVVTIKVQVNAPIENGAQIKCYLPVLTRNPLSASWQNYLKTASTATAGDLSGDVVFITSGSDWVMFEYFARWDDTQKTLTFFVKKEATLPANKIIEFSTIKVH